jgi:anti-sigma regulatory factor (Ser/Thr protein kinase)
MSANSILPISRSLQLRGTFSECEQLHQFIQDFANTQAISLEVLQDLKLVAEEIFANIVEHSYCEAPGHNIDITISTSKNDIKISFIDNATAYNPLEFNTHNDGNRDLCEGGMGIRIIKSLTDAQNYERLDDHNVFTITKHYNS